MMEDFHQKIKQLHVNYGIESFISMQLPDGENKVKVTVVTARGKTLKSIKKHIEKKLKK
jgi:hypothetical protein